MEREEQFEAQLLEGRRGLQAVPILEERVFEPHEVEARQKQETAGAHSQPPPLINCLLGVQGLHKRTEVSRLRESHLSSLHRLFMG